MRLLEVYREVAFAHAVDVVPTLLAAHVVPVEYADRADEYVKLIVKKMIPAVAKQEAGPVLRRLLRAGAPSPSNNAAACWRPAWSTACCPSCTPTS